MSDDILDFHKSLREIVPSQNERDAYARWACDLAVKAAELGWLSQKRKAKAEAQYRIYLEDPTVLRFKKGPIARSAKKTCQLAAALARKFGATAVKESLGLTHEEWGLLLEESHPRLEELAVELKRLHHEGIPRGVLIDQRFEHYDLVTILSHQAQG